MKRLLSTLLCLALLGGATLLPLHADPSDSALAVANADFERVVRPAPTAYGCCFEKWLFAVRSGAYGCSAHERDAGSTCARITSRGKAGRADLLSPFFRLAPFTEVRVRATVKREGATGVIALHPPFQRRHVDLELLHGKATGWRDVDVVLRAGSAAGDYRVTFGVVGEGYVEVDDVRVDVVGQGTRAEGTVLIVDLNERADGYEIPEGWWIGKDIAAIWGYDVVVWGYRELDAKRLRRLDPVAVILSPYAGGGPPTPGEEKAAARRATYPLLEDLRVPTLGICFGCQWLGWSEGVSTQKEGEKGDVLVERLRKDPIFDGLPRFFPCSQSHRFALKRVPPGYLHLGRSETCKVHVIKDKRRSVYGFQGHFERGWEGTTPHGRLILGNFFRQVERRRAGR